MLTQQDMTCQAGPQRRRRDRRQVKCSKACTLLSSKAKRTKQLQALKSNQVWKPANGVHGD